LATDAQLFRNDYFFAEEREERSDVRDLLKILVGKFISIFGEICNLIYVDMLLGGT